MTISGPSAATRTGLEGHVSTYSTYSVSDSCCLVFFTFGNFEIQYFHIIHFLSVKIL